MLAIIKDLSSSSFSDSTLMFLVCDQSNGSLLQIKPNISLTLVQIRLFFTLQKSLKIDFDKMSLKRNPFD